MNLITIDREKCNQDGVCISECPARNIEMDEKDIPFPFRNLRSIA